MNSPINDRGELLSQLKARHKRLSSTLSMVTLLLLMACAAMFWWLDFSYLGHEQIIGAIIMLMAGVMHMTPYLSYRIMRFNYRNNESAHAIFTPGWKMFQKFPGG